MLSDEPIRESGGLPLKAAENIMNSAQWILGGLVSTLVCACNTGLLIGDAPVDGGSTSAGIGGGAGSTTDGAAGVGGASVPTDGADGANPIPGECPTWRTDVAFAGLRLDETALGRVYDVWGLSDDDYYVALGVETASWPNSSSLAAIAHFDGQKWTLDRLPPTVAVAALTGIGHRGVPAIASQLWVLASTPYDPKLLRNAGDGATWTSETLPYKTAMGIVAFSETDGLLSDSSSAFNFADGEVRRLTEGQWVRMTMPDLGVVYNLLKLRMLDAAHVYAVGYSGGANMGSNVIAAFDGSQWRAQPVPVGCGDLADVVGVAPDRIYTVGTSLAASQRLVCRVSPELRSWNVVAKAAFTGDKPTIVATAAGTLVAIAGNYMAREAPAMVLTLRNDIPSDPCLIAEGLGQFVAWSAPGSANVHIFSGQQAGTTMAGARHLAARIDP